MKLRNRILTCALASLTALAGIVSAVAGAQTESGSPAVKGRATRETFVIYRDARGEIACREATPEEHRRIMEARPEGGARLIYRGAPKTRTAAGIVESYPGADKDETSAASSETLPALVPSAGLHVFLHGTQQLESNQAAKNAFIVAANRWEGIISTPINVVIDVDFGTTFFGTPYGDPNILGQTGSSANSTSFANLRQRLLANSPTAAEQSLYNALPASTVPVEGDNGTSTTSSSVVVTRANARALGLVANIANPDAVPLMQGDAGIGFNSAFNFDFNPDDGITGGQTDFDAVVTHEIGHALGFISRAGSDTITSLSVWDVFRFRTGVTLGTVATAQRVMNATGSQIFFDAQQHTVTNSNGSTFSTQELSLSTGGPSGSAAGGDGRQSSHWKDDALNSSRPYIGIMDPTIGSGVRRVITENDTNTLDAFGYAIGGTPAPPPPPPPGPANDNFVSAVVLQGTVGATTGTNVSATHEAGEPAHSFPTGASVWYFWTSPTTGSATFDTVGSNYDTTLAAYTGSAINALTLRADNDDINTSGGNVASRITFSTVANTTYRIQVDGFDGDTGNITLNWTSSGTPPAPVGFGVTGRVVDPDGSPLANVQLSLDGPNLTNGFPALPTATAADGTYSFTLLTSGGNYTVRPSDARYTFSPTTAVFNGISANQSGVNFTATSPASITGTASIAGTSNLLPGVTVDVYGYGAARFLKTTTATDATGHWTVTGLTLGQRYDFVFSKTGYVFNPPMFTGTLPSTPYDVGNVIATRVNPIDTTSFFVSQQYRDFFGREPDAPGLAFWSAQIEQCGTNTSCREAQRINVSGAFFLSIEFQNGGYLVERVYKTSFGDTVEASTGLVIPIIRREEFLPDAAAIGKDIIVGQGNWQAQMEANKVAYLLEFVQRTRFTNAYPLTLTPAQFVANLNTNAGNVLTSAEIASLTNELAANNTASGRASVLRKIAESGELDRREKNRAFVLMQYYGYLRRNPNDAPERDRNFAGWNFWLTKLNDNGGDFHAAQMVKAFLDASEYRDRFVQ